MSMQERGIIALDVPLSEGFALAKKLSGTVWGVKGNTVLLARQADGIPWTTRMRGFGLRVFADAKLHDIPQTVANSVAELAQQGAHLITVSASGGVEMIRAAVTAYEENRPPEGLGVLCFAVLTSLTAQECFDIYGGLPEIVVKRLAGYAEKAGAYGVVCSAKELRALQGLFPTLKRIVPGIRLPGSATHDQARTGTPGSTVRDGADFIVVGRPVTESSDPCAVVQVFDDDIRKG